MKPQKILIQLTVREEARALPILLRHSSGMVLPDRTYLVAEAAVDALRNAGIAFQEIARESNAPNFEGAGAGERI